MSAVALAAFAGACGSSGSTSTSSVAVVGPLANAANVTSKLGGAHIAMSANIETGALPSPVTMTGGGFFNYASHEGTLALTIAGLPSNPATGSSATIEEIFKGSDLYIGSPLFAGKLPGGARWMKLDLLRFGQAVGISPSQMLGGQSNPAQFLEYLKASGGQVQVVGHDTVRGVETTHYRGTIDLTKVASALAQQGSGPLHDAYQKAISKLGTSSLPVDVWLDSQHLVRRIEMTISVPAGAQKLSMHMTVELFGFGTTPHVGAPSASETFDATSSALGGLSSIG